MFIGKEVVAGVFVERVHSGRWMVRSNLNAGKTPERVGEVMGRPGRYVAFTMKGDRISVQRSLAAAASDCSKGART